MRIPSIPPVRVQMHVLSTLILLFINTHPLRASSLADYTYLKTISGMEQSRDLLLPHRN